MRLTVSILEDFPVCEARTKYRYFDHEPVPLTREDLYVLYLGRLAHAGIAAVLRGLEVDRAVYEAAVRERLPERAPHESPLLVGRAVDMTARWKAWHRPERFTCVQYDGAPLIDRKVIVPLKEPIGIFTECVLMADRVCEDSLGQWLYDWKFGGKLGSEEEENDGLRFDLQSAFYQHGLEALGLPVRGVAHVRGLLAEPTPFSRNKNGTVSRRPVRNSFEEYERACAEAGHAPDPGMRDRLLPWFREPRIFRSKSEVDAIWQHVVIPRALAISHAIEGAGFTRRLTKSMCARCPYQAPCMDGMLGRGAGAFATPLVYDRPWQSDAITAADL